MDAQLAHLDPAEAKRRWRENLPCTLKQMALALETSYERVRAWADKPQFPYSDGAIFRADFDLWRQRQFKLRTPPRPYRKEATPPPPPNPAPAAPTHQLPSHAAALLGMA